STVHAHDMSSSAHSSTAWLIPWRFRRGTPCGCPWRPGPGHPQGVPLQHVRPAVLQIKLSPQILPTPGGGGQWIVRGVLLRNDPALIPRTTEGADHPGKIYHTVAKGHEKTILDRLRKTETTRSSLF